MNVRAAPYIIILTGVLGNLALEIITSIITIASDIWSVAPAAEFLCRVAKAHNAGSLNEVLLHSILHRPLIEPIVHNSGATHVLPFKNLSASPCRPLRD